MLAQEYDLLRILQPLPHSSTMEAHTLKRLLDFKLVYDCLANSSNGLVKVDDIASWWPSEILATNRLPRGCVRFWQQSANAEGLIDWGSFSNGLKAALEADASRLAKGELHPPSQAEQKLQFLVAGEHQSVAKVTAGEIERFLSSCQTAGLVKALSRAGSSTEAKKTEDKDRASAVLHSDGKRSTKPEKKHRSSLSIGREKEELMKGVEVLEKTQKWFQNRLAVISLEEHQRGGSEEMKAEDLLAVLEGGEEDSDVLQHLQGINTHLSSLVHTAASPAEVAARHVSPPLVSLNQLASKPPYPQPIAVVEFPNERIKQLRQNSTTGTGRSAPTIDPLDQGRGTSQRSLSLPGTRDHKQRYSETASLSSLTRRKPRRSSSFNDKHVPQLSQPMRTATSVNTLSDQYTDYPGHSRTAQPLYQHKIRHSSSLHSLPTGHYYPSKQHYPPAPSHPPPRPPASLTRPHPPPSPSPSNRSAQLSKTQSSGPTNFQHISTTYRHSTDSIASNYQTVSEVL